MFISIKTYPVNRSLVYIRAIIAPKTRLSITKYMLCFSGNMSFSIIYSPPITVSIITTENDRDKIASSGPALSSFPHGAGKCPIRNVNLSTPDKVCTRRTADIRPITKMQAI